MEYYSKEFKEAALKRLMPPENMSVSKLAKEIGVSDTTIRNWRAAAREEGHAAPGTGKNSEKWSSSDKFLIVMETYSLNEEELAEYCRSKGIFREDIEAWRQSCMSANLSSTNKPKTNEQENKEDKKRIKELEKELKRKEKALAEAAALLVLRKNANAIWGENEDE